ncbi:MAG: hypothetical protein SGJ27_03065 [Candidatus Melainabacteria bacterium]|nr:hypothetical protein [Candidatus Melainabacteria bacterium]
MGNKFDAPAEAPAGPTTAAVDASAFKTDTTRTSDATDTTSTKGDGVSSAGFGAGTKAEGLSSVKQLNDQSKTDNANLGLPAIEFHDSAADDNAAKPNGGAGGGKTFEARGRDISESNPPAPESQKAAERRAADVPADVSSSAAARRAEATSPSGNRPSLETPAPPSDPKLESSSVVTGDSNPPSPESNFEIAKAEATSKAQSPRDATPFGKKNAVGDAKAQNDPVKTENVSPEIKDMQKQALEMLKPNGTTGKPTGEITSATSAVKAATAAAIEAAKPNHPSIKPNGTTVKPSAAVEAGADLDVQAGVISHTSNDLSQSNATRLTELKNQAIRDTSHNQRESSQNNNHGNRRQGIFGRRHR